MEKFKNFLKMDNVKSLIKSKNLPDRLFISSDEVNFTLELRGKMYQLSVQSGDIGKKVDLICEFEILKCAENGDWYHLLEFIEKYYGEISNVEVHRLPNDDFTRTLQWLVTNYLVKNELVCFQSTNENNVISYFDYDNIKFKKETYLLKDAPHEVKTAFVEFSKPY